MGAVACTLFLLRQQQEHRPQPQRLRPNPNRQLLSILPDPKTIESRTISSTKGFLPFNIRPGRSDCVPKENIIQMSRALKDLNAQGIRVFPRNGFLLGVIRHGGYLPTEGIDSDLAVVFEDIERLNLPVLDEKRLKKKMHKWKPEDNNFADFQLYPFPTDTEHWVNWKGNDPLSVSAGSGEEQPYPFHGVKMYRHSMRNGAMLWREAVMAVYPYHHGYYFYPRVDVLGFNHEDHLKETLRWNHEGANMRLVDTDEIVTELNFERGKQIGVVMPTSLDCMVEVQFYFTTIPVPCDYEAILQAQYGIHWNTPEPRSRKPTQHESKVVSVKESDSIMENGPLPLCG